MAAPIHNAVLTAHARSEMARRGVTTTTVASVLAAPEQRLHVRAGRDVLQSRIVIGGRIYLVRVFVDIDRNPPEVVTAYCTSKVAKYWSPGP